MTLRTLVFSNADATPKNQTIKCATESVAPIMAWYGSFFAGDRYTVSLDGRNVKIDGDGEPMGDFP